jgi:hypothetical protein
MSHIPRRKSKTGGYEVHFDDVYKIATCQNKSRSLLVDDHLVLENVLANPSNEQLVSLGTDLFSQLDLNLQ